MKRNPTRTIAIGSVSIGGSEPIVLQSMCATKTTDVEATAHMAETLRRAGAGIVRIAVDSKADAKALPGIRERTTANLSVDLQENWRLAEQVSPYVEKIRYNPGHLHHTEPELPWQEKVKRLVEIASRNDCALRIGVNCGSIDPSASSRLAGTETRRSKRHDRVDPMLISALEHAAFLDSIGFTRYCVSLKESDPAAVVAVNRRFAAERPDIPLHLGVTEAGMPPEGVMKSRLALEPLLCEGIGDTLRVSLTVSNDRKAEEIEAGQLILANVARGIALRPDDWQPGRINMISCPSCARVQNAAFIELAEKVRLAVNGIPETKIMKPLTVAVMGCRVNGPGETDDADLGLWCGPNRVNLKRRGKFLGDFSYEAIIPRLLEEILNFGEKIE